VIETTSVLLIAAGLVAGTQNALAGGGSFITLPALILAGLDPRAANITSTLALFPGQVATGLAGRKLLAGVRTLSFRALFGISLVGGALGALLLLATPSRFFELLLPWLVLFATGAFAWGSFRRRPLNELAVGGLLSPRAAGACQFLIAIYGGYFGGGIGFLMLAVLTVAGQAVRNAGATKNALAAVMNASAVMVFAFSPDAHWQAGALLCLGAVAGGLIGSWMLHKVNEKLLRIVVVIIGIALTIGLFVTY
jgi:uncharacterized membrane protein YfcA